MNKAAQIRSMPLPRQIFFLLCMAGFTLAAYWPSLHGGFVFDDYPNIVDNLAVHMTALDWPALKRAALASPSDLLVRPMAMLTFGLDWYFGNGADPFRMKLENLCIHLLNGVLLFSALRRIARAPNVMHTRPDTLALCVTAAWLLAPINFTGVAYVVQRMESLAQTFVLAGLLGYIAGRERRGLGNSIALPALSLVAGTCLGSLAKESAALLPLYALILEWCVYDFRRNDGALDRRVMLLFATLVGLPALVGSALALPVLFNPASWANRDFTLIQRLLTESRILVHYLGWILLPTPQRLGMYHDNIALSRSLFDPPTTFASIAFLLSLGVTAILKRRRLPLIALGALWYLAAHLLTGTLIPLELVFEHRNYFASIGALLSLFSALMPCDAESRLAFARHGMCIALLGLYAGTCYARSLEWRHPLDFALAEAQRNPQSPRAAMELGRTYGILSRFDANSPLLPLAQQQLERAAKLPNSGALADINLVVLNSRAHLAVPSVAWLRLQENLRQHPLSASDIGGLELLSQCAADGECQPDAGSMVATFIAALSHQPPSPKVLTAYANYVFSALHDAELAVRVTREAIPMAPNDINLRRNLLILLIASNRLEEARGEYTSALGQFPEFRSDARFEALRQPLHR